MQVTKANFWWKKQSNISDVRKTTNVILQTNKSHYVAKLEKSIKQGKPFGDYGDRIVGGRMANKDRYGFMVAIGSCDYEDIDGKNQTSDFLIDVLCNPVFCRYFLWRCTDH